jgi:hypothetical protein
LIFEGHGPIPCSQNPAVVLLYPQEDSV